MAIMKLFTSVRMWLVFGFFLFGCANAQQVKCKEEFDIFDAGLPNKMSDFVIAYNISSTKNVHSCVDFLENMKGLTKDNFTIAYTQDGVKYNRHGTVDFGNKRVSYYYDDNPSEVFQLKAEFNPNGVIVSYVCSGDNQFIWITYDKDRNLEKEADEVAKGLTANPADFKISRDGC